MLIDTHAHIELGDFDRDRDDVVKRAVAGGIGRIVTVGIDLADCRKAVAVAEKYDIVYAAVGIHPHEAKTVNRDTYDTLKKLAGSNRVVAYGEIGLDFFRDRSPRDVQVRCFGEQMELAHELSLPVIIHDRDAHDEILAMLERWNGRVRGIVHCFSGDYGMAKRCLDMGYYVSVPGTITYKNATVLRDVVRRVSLERILVETDCPFLTPEPKRGKRNEPLFVELTARAVARVKGIPFEDVARVTTENAGEIFGIKGVRVKV